MGGRFYRRVWVEIARYDTRLCSGVLPCNAMVQAGVRHSKQGAQISLLSWGGQPESGLVLSLVAQPVAALGTRPHTPLIASHCILRVPRPPQFALLVLLLRLLRLLAAAILKALGKALQQYNMQLFAASRCSCRMSTNPWHNAAPSRHTASPTAHTPAARSQRRLRCVGRQHRFACGATARGNTRPPAVDDGAPLPQLSVRPQCPCSRSTLFFTSWSKDSHLCLSSQGSLPMLLYP